MPKITHSGLLVNVGMAEPPHWHPGFTADWEAEEAKVGIGMFHWELLTLIVATMTRWLSCKMTAQRCSGLLVACPNCISISRSNPIPQ